MTPVSASETSWPASPTGLITSLWRSLQILELLAAEPARLLAKDDLLFIERVADSAPNDIPAGIHTFVF